MRWQNGAFILDGQAERISTSWQHDAKAERVFLELLAQVTAQGRDVSPSVSNTYAPSVFEKHPRADGVTRKQFVAATERLLGINRIRVETTGPPSRRAKRLTPPRKATSHEGFGRVSDAYFGRPSDDFGRGVSALPHTPCECEGVRTPAMPRGHAPHPPATTARVFVGSESTPAPVRCATHVAHHHWVLVAASRRRDAAMDGGVHLLRGRRMRKRIRHPLHRTHFCRHIVGVLPPSWRGPSVCSFNRPDRWKKARLPMSDPTKVNGDEWSVDASRCRWPQPDLSALVTDDDQKNRRRTGQRGTV